MMMFVVFLISLMLFTNASSYGSSYGDKSEKYIGYGDGVDVDETPTYGNPVHNYGDAPCASETPAYGHPVRPPMACIK